jgi:hypothetical protein
MPTSSADSQNWDSQKKWNAHLVQHCNACIQSQCPTLNQTIKKVPLAINITFPVPKRLKFTSELVSLLSKYAHKLACYNQRYSYT